MKPTHTIMALFVAVLTFPMAAVGQDEKASALVASNNETMDNIVVTDQKSLAELRREVYRAEEDFYSVYNKLNDDKEYAVRCYYETPTGTHLKNHICRAKFITNAFSANSARNRNDVSRVANKSANPVIAEKTAKYQAKMETLIGANPELEAALVQYNTMRIQFLTQRETSSSN